MNQWEIIISIHQRKIGLFRLRLEDCVSFALKKQKMNVPYSLFPTNVVSSLILNSFVFFKFEDRSELQPVEDKVITPCRNNSVQL